MTQPRKAAGNAGRGKRAATGSEGEERGGRHQGIADGSNMELEQPGIERRGDVADRRSPLDDRRGRVFDRRGHFADRRRATEARYRAPLDSQLQENLSAWQDANRRRIAADLHDSIGSSLCTIRLKLLDAVGRLPEDAAQDSVGSLTEIVSDVSRAMEEVRRIAMDLRPAILDDLGIVATIGWLARDLQGSQKKIQVEKRIEVEEGRIPDALKTAIFRIVQEGLNNIFSHSGARLARVTLRQDEAELRLTIEDDGKGFTMSSVLEGIDTGRHHGVANMRQRANGSGGVLTIKSAPGAGTVVGCAWPRRLP